VKTKPQKIVRLVSWGTAIIAVLVFKAFWVDAYGWSFWPIENYRIFPFFGVLAFGLMWSHYMTAASRILLKVDKRAVKDYFEITSLVVLFAILLHPGLLIWQLWRDGFGLPPQSYLENYLSPSLKWAAMLGMISFVIFVAYEFRRKFQTKSWWKYVQMASDLAMVFIFIHALKLGRNLQSGWPVLVWYGYGLTTLVALGYIYTDKLKKEKK